MSNNEKVEIVLKLIKAIIGSEWEVVYKKSHIFCVNNNNHERITIMTRDWDYLPIFDIRVSSLSEVNNPNVKSNESDYYKAIGALMTNPCIKVVEQLLSEVSN